MEHLLKTDFKPPRKQVLRWLIPTLLVLLFLCVLLWLPWQARQMESHARQEQLIADTLWVEQTIRFQLGNVEEALHAMAVDIGNGNFEAIKFNQRMNALVQHNREILRVTWLDREGQSLASTDNTRTALSDLSGRAQLAVEAARITHTPRYSQPAPPHGLSGPVLMEYVVPIFVKTRYVGCLIATYRIDDLLEELVPWWFARDNQIVIADINDHTLAKRASGGPGRNIFTHSRTLDLPGAFLTLHTNSTKTEPRLLPNLLIIAVIALSFGLIWSLWALWRDIARRLKAEDALRHQIAFRTAMGNSLSTGLRARDLQGRITYVNPAFSKMVGFPPSRILGKVRPPYWTPEGRENQEKRLAEVLEGKFAPPYETIFQRANGERFPALIMESPLIDEKGVQTGWMGSILDISEQKRIAEINRQQQEQLQASARLANLGEIASTLAHELNQPLAAISNYTAGAINLLQQKDPPLPALQSALKKAQEQTLRAGQIIRSVHQFIKKREPSRQPVEMRAMIDSILPLIEMQARRQYVAIEDHIPAELPPIMADRIMLEQVVLNLTRNAIEAMKDTEQNRRILRLEARVEPQTGGYPKLIVSIIDSGHGIPEDVAQRLFSPFFTTKDEGMGMGLKISRSAIEFHGGELYHRPNPGGGTQFCFELPIQPEEEPCCTSSTTKK